MNPNPALSAPMPFPPGTVIAGGKYRVNKLLGEGGMGWVVVAIHLQLEQRVALKFMRSAKNPEAVARFLREARAAARIQSEHVARVSDVGTLENGSPYLVMEYLDGEDLSALIEAKGAIPDYLAIDYAMQACEGLAEAHAAGIIHRDLKPANLFLARRTDGSVRVKLLDFGISKLSTAPGSQPEINMTSTQALMGSPLYMAPEQMRSSKSVDRRADIWSMGTIIYEMLTGRSPFEGNSLPEVCARILADNPVSMLTIVPDLAPELDGVVLRCLEKDPAKRFPDVAALAHALSPFGTDEIRSTAERIGRVSRVLVAPPSERVDSSPIVPHEVDAESAVATNPLVRQALDKEAVETQVSKAALGATSASFTRGSGAPRGKRANTLPLALAGGGLAGAIILGIAFVAMRGPQSDPAATASAGSGAASHPIAADTTATPKVTVTPPPQPVVPTVDWTALPTAAPATAATASTTVTLRPAPTPTVTPAAARTTPAPHASTTPTAKTSAAPAATSSFGGRD